MINPSIIGVVGGVGPYAGIDLVRKIFDQTVAENDQQHLSVAMLSIPSRIEPRTDFLLGEIDTNPAAAVADIICQLEQLGVGVIGIPCNTMFAPPIFEVIIQKLKAAGCDLEPVHMIKNTAAFMGDFYPAIRKVGLLCTRGTYLSNIYQDCLEPAGLEVLLPDETAREELVHNSILDQDYGIKAHSNPVTDRARDQLLQVISDLEAKGAQAVVLGCTELPLAITETKIGSAIMIDPTMLLARKLISLVAPGQLKSLAD